MIISRLRRSSTSCGHRIDRPEHVIDMEVDLRECEGVGGDGLNAEGRQERGWEVADVVGHDHGRTGRTGRTGVHGERESCGRCR